MTVNQGHAESAKKLADLALHQEHITTIYASASIKKRYIPALTVEMSRKEIVSLTITTTTTFCVTERLLAECIADEAEGLAVASEEEVSEEEVLAEAEQVQVGNAVSYRTHQ